MLTGPLTSLGASCLGPCAATLCCHCAASGTVSSAYAARQVLFWLQAFTIVLALILAGNSSQWLTAPCEKLKGVGIEDFGVCACYGSPDKAKCWSEHIVWRMEASAFVVFALLLVASLSGCARGASRSYEVAKFMAVFVLGVVSLFLPNALFSSFGSVASSASAVFLVVQTVWLIDFAYSWNELWFTKARELQQSRRKQRFLLGAIISTSVLLIVASIAACVGLYTGVPTTAGKVVAVSALVISCLLLFLSITKWCKHGALLTSAVMMAYSMWLVFEAFALQSSGGTHQAWVGFAGISLFFFARGTRRESGSGGAALIDTEGGGGTEADGSEGASDFAMQCAVHAAATMYFAGGLAPQPGDVPFWVHIGAVFCALALYGWTLVAPMVLKNRQF